MSSNKRHAPKVLERQQARAAWAMLGDRCRCLRTVGAAQCIAKRVSSFIEIASTTHEVGSLERFAAATVEERAQVIAQGVKSTLDQRWVAPAFAEAWCVARLGLYNRSLSRHSAMAVIGAIEAFALERPTCLTRAPTDDRLTG